MVVFIGDNYPPALMAGLDPATQGHAVHRRKGWIPGSSPGMREVESYGLTPGVSMGIPAARLLR